MPNFKTERGTRRVRKISGRVAVSGGTPSVSKGTGFTVTDTAPGQVTVTLTRPGKSFLAIIATPIESTDATGHYVKVKSVTEASAVVFNVYVADGTDGVLVDNVGFYFEITVKDVTA